MSNIRNDLKQAESNAQVGVTRERRQLVAQLLLWLRAHPHTILALAAAAVILAITFGAIRG